MTDTVYLVTEWLGDADDPILIFEDMADASEYCARENRAVHKLVGWPDDVYAVRFDYQPIQIQRGEKS